MSAPVDTRAAKVTSADVRAALVLRYPKDSHALMFEVPPSTGGGTTYADAVAVGLWASHGHQIEGFEIKVARSDWLSELRQPGKSEPVMRYCHRWWLVCPPGVATADELPPGWGVLEMQAAGTLRVRVKAPKLEPVEPTRGFFAALVRRGANADGAALAVLLEREGRAQHERIREQMERERRHELTHKQQSAIEAVARLEALSERTGIDLSSCQYGDDWFKAVEMMHSLGSDYGAASLRQLMQNLRSCIAAVDKSGLLSERDPA